MACLQHTTTVELAARKNMALPDIRGTALHVTRGTIWITQENDTEDIVLRAGDLWMVERDGLTIIEAQNDATFCALGHRFERGMRAANAAESRMQALWRHLREKIDTAFEAAARRPVPYY